MIKVPVELLNETLSSMSKVESTLTQSMTVLNKALSDLKLEAASRKIVDTKIIQARTMSSRLSAESNRLSTYVSTCNSRFVEADRREMGSVDKLSSIITNTFSQTRDQITDMFPAFDTYTKLGVVMGGVFSAAGMFGGVLLPWIKDIINPGPKTFVPPIDKPSMEKSIPGHEKIGGRDYETLEPIEIIRSDEWNWGWQNGARNTDGSMNRMLNDSDTLDAIKNASRETGVSVENLMAMAIIESSGNKDIGTNIFGYTGLMQIGRAAAADIGIPYENLVGAENVENNALAGAKYWNINARRLNDDIPRDPLHLFLAHNQGAGGTNQLMHNLDSNPDNPPPITRNQRSNLPASFITEIANSGEQVNQRHFYDYWKGYMTSIQEQVQEQVARHNI